MRPVLPALLLLAGLATCNATAPIVSPTTDLAALRADAQLDNAVLTAQRVYDTLPASVQAQAYPILAKAVDGRKAADAAYVLADGSFAAKASAVTTLLAQFHAIAGK